MHDRVVLLNIHFVDVHIDDNLSVHDIPHMSRSMSIDSLNIDDWATSDSFQKEANTISISLSTVNL